MACILAPHLTFVTVAILYGTSRDVSELISLLPTYLSTEAEFKFRRIFCVGVSLGGHSTYIALSDGKQMVP